ncbi:MBL fold metallo-hydrolase, partial [Burkholderia cenocepacia]|nr:MBL fold metallo-hydrolase [Burkholderia cenocepacia]
RIAQLREHHDARLAEVRVACAEQPMSAADIVPIMFRRRELDIHQMTFALGEALAHEFAREPQQVQVREQGD